MAYKDRAKNSERSGRGLTDEQVASSRAEHGSNCIGQAKQSGFIRKFIGNLGDPIIRILLTVLVLNIILTFRNINWIESLGILAAITIATMVSTISEYGSQRAFDKLRDNSAKAVSRVMRNGEIKTIAVDEIVVGDLVYLSAGEKIPADGRIISGEVYVDQSALNGESKEIRKRKATDNIPPFELASADCLFRGSLVCEGNATMEIIKVGTQTVYGSIATELAEETRISPLKLRLTKLARSLSKIGYMAGGVIAFGYLFNVFVISSGFDWYVIMDKITDLPLVMSTLTSALTIGITIIVVSVPEGLPMMITVVLSSNMKRMMKDNVLVKKLVGIETAGSLNMLFTDKTGTITTGKLSVEKVILADGTSYSSSSDMRKSNEVHRLFTLAARYNVSNEVPVSDASSHVGNSTEKAVYEFSRSDVGMYSAVVDKKILFNSDRKFSAASVTIGSGKLTLIKGAPEMIMSRCRRCITLSGQVQSFDNQARVKQTISEISANAGRVIALAFAESELSGNEDLPNELVFFGIVAIRDRLRRQAPAAVRQLKSAGIIPVIITGDSEDTARAIALECGIMTPNGKQLVITSTKLAQMSDGEVTAILPNLGVVARALPSDKSRLVRIAQQANLVVGMTGDGINDAPALKKADVGFAMGSGTEIAREAGDIVILDNNLASIAKAVLYGRTIFRSIRKFITFQLTMNLCAVGVSLLGQLMGIATPITVVQMLWVNIIMDTLGGLAFAGEAPLLSYMKERPKKRDESILNGSMIKQISALGLFAIALCAAFLSSTAARNHFGFWDEPIYFMTAFYALFIFTGVMICFVSRSERINIFANLSQNKPFMLIMAVIVCIQIGMLYFGGEVFRTAGLSLRELGLVIMLALCVLPVDFARRIIVRGYRLKKRRAKRISV